MNFSFSLFLKRKEKKIAGSTRLGYLINFARSSKIVCVLFLERRKKNLPYSFQITSPINFRLRGGGENWVGEMLDFKDKGESRGW